MSTTAFTNPTTPNLMARSSGTGAWPAERVAELPEHLYSSVFPRRSTRWIKDKAKQYAADGRGDAVVVVNGFILSGYHCYQAYAEAGMPVYVLDFGDVSDKLVDAYAIGLNTFSRDLTWSDRLAAFARLLTDSNGSIAIDWAASICGLHPNDPSVAVGERPTPINSVRP